MIKTYNRGLLKRQVIKGEMLIKCNYRMSDDYRADDAYNFGKTEKWVPAKFSESDCISSSDALTLTPFSFRTKSGCAWLNEDGTITLIVHSNLSYQLKAQ